MRCCGPQCDLPWAVEVSRQTIQEGSDEHGFASHGRRGQASEPASKGLLVLAPGFFKVRHDLLYNYRERAPFVDAAVPPRKPETHA